jgi:hypothetical protein
VLLIALLSLVLLAQHPDTGLAAEVRRAVLQEPLETFAEDTGHVSVSGVTLLDIDGRTEAFVWIVPSFRQTPTVLVYERTANGGLHRLVEGFAPGRLQPLSGRFRDSHTLGEAVDLTVGHSESVDTLAFISAALQQSMSLVQYHTFFHADFRRGSVFYVDLSDRAPPVTDSITCAKFEFSRVDGLAGGHLAGDSTTYLVALTSQDVTIYRFDTIRASGMLIKHSWMRPRPPSTTGIVTGSTHQVQLTTGDGRVLAIAAP